MTPWLENIRRDPAADFGNRRGLDPTVVVIHYTGGGRLSGAVDTLTAYDDRFVSAHFVIGMLGETRQLVALDRRAFHAGVSEWRYQDETIGDVNRYSIGIELVNRGRVGLATLRAADLRGLGNDLGDVLGLFFAMGWGKTDDHRQA